MHSPDPKADHKQTQKPEDDATLQSVEVLEIEDDLDTGMHRVNVCPSPA